MNLNDNKTSGELRIEISQDLDRLDHKVDNLKNRLTPGQILDDAVFSSCRGNPKASYRYLKDNPIGTSFLVMGTLLLMDNEGESYEQTLRTQSGVLYQDYKQRAEEFRFSAIEARDQLSEKISDISGDIKYKAKQLAQRGEEGIDRVKGIGRDLKQKVVQKVNLESEVVRDNVIDATANFKERAQESLQALNLDEIGANDMETGNSSKKIKQRAAHISATVRDYGQSAIDKIKENNLDSLSYPALGIAAGFAIGGIIPLSDEEISVSSEINKFELSNLRRDLENAANESMNIFKNELVDSLKTSNIDIF